MRRRFAIATLDPPGGPREPGSDQGAGRRMGRALRRPRTCQTRRKRAGCARWPKQVRLTCPRQRSFEPGSKTGIRASYTRTTREEFPVLGPAFLPPFGRPASAFLGTLSCPGVQPPLRSAYRTACAYPRLGCGPMAGFTRSARVRPGPGRAPSLPRERRCPLAIELSVAAACRLSAAGSCHPGTATSPGCRCHEASARVSG